MAVGFLGLFVLSQVAARAFVERDVSMATLLEVVSVPALTEYLSLVFVGVYYTADSAEPWSQVAGTISANAEADDVSGVDLIERLLDMDR